MSYSNVVITGTGSYIPKNIVTNSDFAKNVFYQEDGRLFDISNEEIVEKFKAITGIEERRYVSDDLDSSDIASIASREAVEDAGIDPETIDQIIVAQNFGNVKHGTIQTDLLPSLASRIKYDLGIKNPNCVGYDIIFGCPGWVQGVIQANSFIKSGMAKRCLVVGTETLSRVIDKHDRNSMIFSDGAGACIIEGKEEDQKRGLLSSQAMTHTAEEAYYLFFGKSNHKAEDERIRYIKMHGRKVYEYAMTHVPQAMKNCLDAANIDIHDLKKVFLHQANEKMDEGMIKRLFRLYDLREIPEHIMPMSIHKLGNSSVATVPTLYDLVRKGKKKGHELHTGDHILFASVGAGMNINAVAYKY